MLEEGLVGYRLYYFYHLYEARILANRDICSAIITEMSARTGKIKELS
jgi:hypothetical protein